MIFANASYRYVFGIILVIMVLMLLGYRRRHQQLTKLIHPTLWPVMVPLISYSRRFWMRVLGLVAFIFVLIAVMRPQYGYVFQQVERRGHDVYIVLDLSHSMQAQDTQPSRLEHAKREILALIDLLQGDRLGLVVFAGHAVVACPLTTDYDALKQILAFQEPGLMTVPGTDVATAIKTARVSLQRLSKRKEKAVVILSDGESFENDPVESAGVASKKGIMIYTIGIGTKKGEPLPRYDTQQRMIGYKKDRVGQVVVSQLNETVLRDIAAQSNGAYFHTDTGTLVASQVYAAISKREAEQLEETLLSVRQERYQWPLAMALLVLACATGMPTTTRRKGTTT